jgi:hypothetical protein
MQLIGHTKPFREKEVTKLFQGSSLRGIELDSSVLVLTRKGRVLPLVLTFFCSAHKVRSLLRQLNLILKLAVNSTLRQVK